MSRLTLEIVILVLLYGAVAFGVWKTWPLTRQLPTLITESLERWSSRVQLEQEERAFLRKFAKAHKEERKELTIARLRVHLLALGIDVSDFTDAEIEEATMRFAEALGSSGITAEQAASNIASAFAQSSGDDG